MKVSAIAHWLVAAIVCLTWGSAHVLDEACLPCDAPVAAGITQEIAP